MKTVRFESKIDRFDPKCDRFEVKIVRFEMKSDRFKSVLICTDLNTLRQRDVGAETTCQKV